MRQDWFALWEENGEQRESVFTSLEHECIARISFEIDRLKQNLPVPAEYRVQKIGEPYAVPYSLPRSARDQPPGQE